MFLLWFVYLCLFEKDIEILKPVRVKVLKFFNLKTLLWHEEIEVCWVNEIRKL